MGKSNKTEHVEKDVPESDCIEWLEDFLKKHGAVKPKDVYAAGVKEGFTRNGIKAARRYFGALIETIRTASDLYWAWKS